MRISLFFMNVCLLRNKVMLMWSKNISSLNVQILPNYLTTAYGRFWFFIEKHVKSIKSKIVKILCFVHSILYFERWRYLFGPANSVCWANNKIAKYLSYLPYLLAYKNLRNYWFGKWKIIKIEKWLWTQIEYKGHFI